jgi:secondary thiamine-phosphate synthase enzyme
VTIPRVPRGEPRGGVHADGFTVETTGRGIVELTARVAAIVDAADATHGLCNVFVHHTSASLILCENADPTVRADLERFAARWAPDGDPIYRHTDEGPDDMPAHVRSVFAGSSLVVPIREGRLDLGTWQGVYLWEHRTAPHQRRVSVTILR